MSSQFQDLISGYPPLLQDLAVKARELVLEAAPGAHQEFEKGWGGYWLFKQVAGAGNSVCWLSVSQKHVSLGFSEGAQLSDPDGLLEGKGKHSRQVRLKPKGEVAWEALRRLLGQAWERQPQAAQLEEGLERVRQIALALPGTSEKLSHGHPTFYAGKRSFAVFGIYSPSVAFKPRPATAIELAQDGRFFPTPYMARHGWWSLRLEDSMDWEEVGSYLRESYLQVAPRSLSRSL